MLDLSTAGARLRARLAACAVAVALIGAAATAHAQNRPGVSFDQTITTVSSATGHFDSSTSVMRQISAGQDSRLEVTVNGLYPTVGPFTPGLHPVLLVHSGGTETVFLNPDSKEYMVLRPFEMMAGFKKMLEGMGGSLTVDTAATKVSFDSVGDGPTISGYKTVHYRQGTTLKMAIAMMGQVSNVEDRSVSDIYAAPDLADLNQLSAGALDGVTAFSHSMGFGKELSDKVTENQRRIHGFPLRVVQHSTKNHRTGEAPTLPRPSRRAISSASLCLTLCSRSRLATNRSRCQ